MPIERPDTGVAPTPEAVLETVHTLAAELHPQRAPPHLTLDSTLDRDAGLDSLARVELLARLERTSGRRLPEQQILTAETVHDLWRLLAAAAPAPEHIPAPTRTPTLGAAESAPESALTLWDVLAWHVRTHPQRPHLTLLTDADTEETLDYATLARAAEAIGAGLQARGVQPGQTVAIMLPTCREYFTSFFGVLAAGAIPVPIYPPVRAAQIEDHLRRHGRILVNARAAALITVPEARPLARLLRLQAPELGFIATADELTGATAAAPPALRAADIALLQYTSGSTGNPKGVILTHANLLANIRAMGETVRATSTDVFVSWMPLYHDMGLIGAWLGSLYYAIPLVVMSPLAFLARPEHWLWAIHRHRATISGAPNFGYELCLRRIADDDLQGLDLSSWRLAFNGAEPVSPATPAPLQRALRALRLQARDHGPGVRAGGMRRGADVPAARTRAAIRPRRARGADAHRARAAGGAGRRQRARIRRLAAGRCRVTTFGWWTAPVTKWASARKAAWNSAARPRPAAITATSRKPAGCCATVGSTRAISPTWPGANCSSPGG